jgi:hypothetical protein
MLPTGLFVDAPELHDDSMHQLTNDTEAWPEEIITKLKERVPEVNGMNAVVKFMKLDEETGTATGSILVTNAKKSAVVPLIIKDFAMYPLDIFIVDNKLLPLTPDFFKAAFLNTDAFAKLEEYPTYAGMGRFEDGNLWNVTYPPSLGRYAYASAGYPVLDIISSTVSGADLKKELLADTASALRFHKHGHAEVIKKVANLQPVNMNEFSQAADNLIQRNIVMLKKEGPHKYSLLSNSDKVFAPQITQIKPTEFKPYMTAISATVGDDMNEVDMGGEKIVYIEQALPNDQVYLEKGLDVQAEIASEYGNFVVKKKNGVEVEGIVIPKVIGFDMDVLPMKIFIGKTMSTMQTEIAGVRLQNGNFELPFDVPAPGQTGCFVYMHGPKNGLATVPVTIRHVTDWMGDLKLAAHDLLGKEVKIKMSCGMELERIALVNGEYVLPKRMKWVPMEGFFEVSNSPVDYAVKTAGTVKTANPVKLIKTSSTSYSIKGADKYAQAIGWDKTNLEPYQAKFLLASLGASNEKVASILKTAGERGFVTIHGLRSPLTKQEKIAKAVPTAKKMLKVANDLKSNLVKAASYVENSQTVDALLALNFVNPENIGMLVSKVPSFKAAISHLASCLIASRIGMKEIPEQSVSSAMTRLIEVVNGLETLRATTQEE